MTASVAREPVGTAGFEADSSPPRKSRLAMPRVSLTSGKTVRHTWSFHNQDWTIRQVEHLVRDAARKRPPMSESPRDPITMTSASISSAIPTIR
jgi:hypothetical protein